MTDVPTATVTRLAAYVQAGDIPTYEPMELIIADTTQVFAPTSVLVMLNGADPGEDVEFTIDEGTEVVWTADVDSNGSLYLVSVAIPSRADSTPLAAGDHVLHATAVTSGKTGEATFTLQQDPAIYAIVQSADVDPVEIPGRGNSWALQDPKPGGLGSWVMHPSPTSMTEPELSKTVDVDHTTDPVNGRYHISVTDVGTKDWSWSGYCPDQEFNDQMEAYAALNRRIWVLDHRGRAWKATITNFDPVLRKRQINDDGTPQDWASDYTVTAVIYDHVWLTPETP